MCLSDASERKQINTPLHGALLLFVGLHQALVQDVLLGLPSAVPARTSHVRTASRSIRSLRLPMYFIPLRLLGYS